MTQCELVLLLIATVIAMVLAWLLGKTLYDEDHP